VQELGGAEPGSEPKLANGNIPHRRRHTQFMNGGWPGGQESALLVFHEFESSLVRV